MQFGSNDYYHLQQLQYRHFGGIATTRAEFVYGCVAAAAAVFIALVIAGRKLPKELLHNGMPAIRGALFEIIFTLILTANLRDII